MSEWISVKDKLPDNNLNVLVSDGETVFEAEFYRYPEYQSVEFNCPVTGDIYGQEITHWQYLPELPTPEQGE